ncbi:hypothetical protein B1H10_00810 [candidate division KSB1 bacterium 4484_188]|nr:MAG: hypothetical protein B1H10_00810 [candidate division KSB1 bacterium 4484_188]HFE63075.1 purine-binding chemotaxis protein CheW [Caldithrix sp.]
MSEKRKTGTAGDRISVIEINTLWFGIDILKSREVIPLPRITPVPNTPEFVLGVFNLRGDIFTLLDISTILDMKAKQIQNSDMVILLDNNNTSLGILADRILGVRFIDNTRLKPSRGVVSQKMAEFVAGVLTEKNSEIYLLDIDRLFASAALRADNY